MEMIKTNERITLSPQQARVIACLAADMDTKQIAKEMKIASRTVMAHLMAVKEKYNRYNRCGLVSQMMRDNFLFWDDENQVWKYWDGFEWRSQPDCVGYWMQFAEGN